MTRRHANGKCEAQKKISPSFFSVIRMGSCSTFILCMVLPLLSVSTPLHPLLSLLPLSTPPSLTPLFSTWPSLPLSPTFHSLHSLRSPPPLSPPPSSSLTNRSSVKLTSALTLQLFLCSLCSDDELTLFRWLFESHSDVTTVKVLCSDEMDI